MQKQMKVLITGLGSPAALGVIKSLKRIHEVSFYLVGIDCYPDVAAKARVDRFYPAPSASSEDFIPFVHHLCETEKIDCILPLVTAELYSFAEHVLEFRKIGTNLAISPVDSIALTNDKALLFEHLEQLGIEVPRFKLVKTPLQLKQAITDLGYPDKPVCFKPTFGDGSRGFHFLTPSIDRVQQIFFEKPNSAYISSVDLYHVLRSNPKIPPLLVMEYLPNEEYSVDILADHGTVQVAIPRLREHVVGGITTVGTIVEEKDIIAYCTGIVRALRLHGNIGIQVRRDECGLPKILEINPRLQGTTIHCTGAGVNLPFLAIKLAKGLPITNEELIVCWGTKMVRFWEEMFDFPENKQKD